MSEEPISLAERRAAKAGDSSLWSPLDMLRHLVRKMEAGEIVTEKMAVHYLLPLPDGCVQHQHHVAGFTHEGHISLLVVAQADALSDWRR